LSGKAPGPSALLLVAALSLAALLSGCLSESVPYTFINHSSHDVYARVGWTSCAVRALSVNTAYARPDARVSYSAGGPVEMRANPDGRTFVFSNR